MLMNNDAKSVVVWFRNDLRLRDNLCLINALQRSENIIPVYCFDPRQFRDLDLGFPKTNIHRAEFLLKSVYSLRENLSKKGGDLVIRYGKPEEVIPDIVKEKNIQVVFASKEVTSEEVTIESKLKKALQQYNTRLELTWQSTLIHPGDLLNPIERFPEQFSQFRKKAEKYINIHEEKFPPYQLNTVENISSEVVTIETLGFDEELLTEEPRFIGGEDEAWSRLNYYFWESGQLKQYKYTRNGLLGEDYSSKFSPWLAHGCISPRSIYWQVQKYEEEVKKNSSTYWLVFELLWRDFFRFIALKHGNKLFLKTGIKDIQIPVYDDHGLFEAWAKGETGIPFIDANIKELNQTGFMSNRGRQNVASFLVKDLEVNWTWGAAYFESMLTDYDPCSNWGNWNYVAGVGNDSRDNRYFNILWQAKKYDKDGKYVKYWIPELEPLSTDAVLQPHLHDHDGLLDHQSVYLNPITELPALSER